MESRVGSTEGIDLSTLKDSTISWLPLRMMQIISSKRASVLKVQFGLHPVIFTPFNYRNQELYSILSLLTSGMQRFLKKSGAHQRKKLRR
jgi:hypothetical protein